MLIVQPDREGVQKAVQVLRAGGVIAYQTDTVWGLSADGTNLAAVARIHAIKQSNASKPLLTMAPSIAYVYRTTILHAAAKRLIKAYWPGPLALIVDRRDGSGSVGLRYPAHPLSQQLVRMLKKPLITTSANLHGKSPCTSMTEVLSTFTDLAPDLVIYAPRQRAGKPSTIIDCTGEMPRIVREGTISGRMLAKALVRPKSARV